MRKLLFALVAALSIAPAFGVLRSTTSLGVASSVAPGTDVSSANVTPTGGTTQTVANVAANTFQTSIATSGIALDGTDVGSAFNTWEAAQPANRTLVLPAGKTLGTSVQIGVSVAGHVLQCEPGAKVALLSGAGNINATVNITASSVTLRNCEIDNSAYVGANLISGWRTTGELTGVKVLGVYVHDTTQYGGKIVGGAQVTVDGYDAINTTYDCLHTDNTSPDTTQARVTTIKVNCNRSGQDRTTNAWPSMQVIGTATHPTILHQVATTLFNVVNPVSGSSEGEEVRYVIGEIDGYVSNDGSIGLSDAVGTKDLNVSNASIKGPTLIGLEGGAGGNSTVSNLTVDGKNAGGTATTGRCVAFDGGAAASKSAIKGARLSGCTDEVIFANALLAGGSLTIPQWSDIDLSDIDMDCSSINNAQFPAETAFSCINLGGDATHIGASRVHFKNVRGHGGGVATRLLKATNANYIDGDIGGDNINGALVELLANTLASDNISLNVTGGAGNVTTSQIIQTLLNGGTLGSHIQITGDQLIGNATGFSLQYRDFASGLIEGYGTSTPNAVLDGAIGSTVKLTSGALYKKSTALGTLTGWNLFSDAANHLYDAGTQLGTFATANAATPPAIGSTTPAAGTFTSPLSILGLTATATQLLATSPDTNGIGLNLTLKGGAATTTGNGGAVTQSAGVGCCSGDGGTGGNASMSAGAGSGTGAGGSTNSTGGAGGATGNGGSANLTGGKGGSTSGTGGGLNLTAGAGGDTTAGNGGTAALTGGAGGVTSGTGAGGSVQLTGGAGGATSGNGGAVTIKGGSVASGTVGAVSIQVSNNGNTNINTGTSTGTIHIGDGSGNNTIGIGNGTGVVTGASPWTFSNATVKMTGITTGTNADTVCLKADGTLLIQAAACTISSLRFKQDVKPWAQDALQEINAFTVDSFRMKPADKPNADPNYGREQVGLIAENIAKVEPKCALYEPDMKTPKSYRQECVIALLVKGEQELIAQNVALKKRLAKLERLH